MSNFSFRVSPERAQLEAEEICSTLWLKFDGNDELARLAHRRAATLAMMLRLYVEDERQRLSAAPEGDRETV